MDIIKPITLDLLETKGPALSATSDVPVIETKPDASPESKPAAEKPKADEPKAKEEVKADTAAAPAKDAKTDIEDESADVLEQPESTSASDKPKPAKGVQKRLDELTRQAREAERREQAALEREARLLALVENKDKPKAAPDVTEPAKPKREDFPSDEAYDDARISFAGDHAAWRVTQEFESKQKAEREKQEQASIAEQSRKVQQAYVARVEKFKEAHPDYSEVAESPDVSVSIPMAHAIAHSEQGPEIAYFLGSNPDEAKRIAQLAPPVQLMELGLIVAKLKAPTAKPVSAAPAPLKPIKAGSETPTLTPEEESMEQYAARRKKEMAAQARPGVRH